MVWLTDVPFAAAGKPAGAPAFGFITRPTLLTSADEVIE
jgi:hypothetical protein